MRIMAVRHAVPSLKVSNSQLIEHLQSLTLGDPNYIAQVERFLQKSGANTRYYLSTGERACDVLNKAVKSALASAAVSPKDIDLIIYGGVARGWLEPSMANYVQNLIGAKRATCFDVLEACASWLRAVQVASHFLKQGTCRLALIVNCECGIQDYASPEFLAKAGKDQLGAFTLGEAATATIISSSNDDDTVISIRSFGEHYNLCMMPLIGAHQFHQAPPNGQFAARSEALFIATISRMIGHLIASPEIWTRFYDLFFFHSASAKATGKIQRRFQIPSSMIYCTYSRFGNTGAASIPLGLSCALDDGLLGRGKKILIGVGSAGVSVGFMGLTF